MFFGYAGFANQRPQSSFGQFAVIGNKSIGADSDGAK
jgi:hypothetical protein